MVRAPASAIKRSMLVLETFSSVEDRLYGIVSTQTVLGDGSRDVDRATSSTNVHMLPWIDAASNGNCLTMPSVIRLNRQTRLLLNKIRRVRQSARLILVLHPRCGLGPTVLRVPQTV